GDPGSSRFFISLDDKLMRLFAGDFVKRVMQWAGLNEGEPITSPMVTRRVEGAQKKIEERHFDQRKNLLEYDEVMDEQRKRTYSYRQQILDGEDCRELLLGMIDDQIDHWTEHYLSRDYRWDSIADWVGQKLHMDCPVNSIRNMDRQQLEAWLRDEGERQAESLIEEQLDVNLPEDAEDRSEWNWMSLTRWANRHFGLNLQDKDLRHQERADLPIFLLNQARESIKRWDLSGLDGFMETDFPQKTLAGWANYTLMLDVTPDDFRDLEAPGISALLKERARSKYDQKEIEFPVSVGLHSFLQGDGTQGERYNREKLARWANTRFGTQYQPEEFANLSTQQIIDTLTEDSRRFLTRRPDMDGVRSRLNELLGDAEPDSRLNDKQVSQIVDWAAKDLHVAINPDYLRTLTTSLARLAVQQGIDRVFRPELQQTERSVLLEILDTNWKDHLYHMGHLRVGIGFVGYAQKDPRTEYKREGRKAFLAMWDRIAEQVTQAIFRIEQQSPAFVGSLWRITATAHDVAPPVESTPADNYETSGPEPGEEGKTIAPIVNDEPKVGRNDPCPCGSG
ncbi:MAG: preprotein translocase subunit SecA, partial [Planctomycetaceae bacterium]|nr:preprotein translocase subunit SecA [Planctomycetaceae bacterium]